MKKKKKVSKERSSSHNHSQQEHSPAIQLNSLISEDHRASKSNLHNTDFQPKKKRRSRKIFSASSAEGRSASPRSASFSRSLNADSIGRTTGSSNAKEFRIKRYTSTQKIQKPPLHHPQHSSLHPGHLSIRKTPDRTRKSGKDGTENGNGSGGKKGSSLKGNKASEILKMADESLADLNATLQKGKAVGSGTSKNKGSREDPTGPEERSSLELATNEVGCTKQRPFSGTVKSTNEGGMPPDFFTILQKNGGNHSELLIQCSNNASNDMRIGVVSQNDEKL